MSRQKIQRRKNVNPRLTGQQLSVEDLKKTDFLVFRDNKTGNVVSVASPNTLQVGLFDKNFTSDLKVTGNITGSIVFSRNGFSGSLTRLLDGSAFINAGSNINIVTGSDGAITISTSTATGTTTNALTVGDGIQLNSGTTFDGSAARTISLDLKSSGGLKIDSTELAVEPANFAGSGLADDGSDNLKIDIPNQTNVTAATGDYVLIADASDSFNLKRTTVASIQSVSSFDIAGLGSSLDESTLAKEDLIAVADVNDSNNVKKITVEDIAEFLSGEDANSGLSENNGILGLYIHNLTEEVLNPAEDYIAFSDEGTAGDPTRKESVLDFVDSIRGTPSSTALTSSSGILNVDITGLGTTTIATNDEIMIYDVDASSLKKATIADLSVGAAPVDATYVTLSSNGTLTNESVLTAGDGIDLSSATISLDLKSSGGLKIDSTELAIEPSDIAGSGLEDDGSDNLRISSAAAGTGLTGGGGSALSVLYGNSSSTAAQGTNTITVTAGDGLIGGGSAIIGNASTNLTLDINPEDFVATGLKVYNNNINTYLQAGANVTITTGSESQLIIASDMPIPGDGLDLTGTTLSLDIKSGSGLVIDSTELSTDNSIIAMLSGSQFTGNVSVTGSLEVKGGISGSLTHLADGSSYLIAGSNISITTGSSGAITVSAAGAAVSEAFKTISVAGQDDIVADSMTDTLTLAAGSNITITTDATSDTVTISSAGGGGGGSTTIGNAEDGSYTDGLFTDFTSSTPIGTAIDRFNEILLSLAPAAAPDLDNIDNDNSAGITAFLSFGASNDQSSAGTPYFSSATAAGFSAVDVNGSYAAATSGENIRKGIYDGSTVITGDLNEDVALNQHNTGVTNHVANAFGNADSGTLKLFVNGAQVHSVDLSQASAGTGNPGSGTKSQLNSNGSGFISLSQTGSAVQSNNIEFTSFQHRTGKYQIGTADQRKGWNYAQVIHTLSSGDLTTNFVEWVNDPDANALSATNGRFSEIGISGSLLISGIKYNTSASAVYNTKVDNAYRYVYDDTNITFTTTNGTISAQSKPTIGGSETHEKALHITGSMNITTAEMLGTNATAAINVTHPIKSNLSSAGSATASGFLIFNVTNSSTELSETFTMENHRLKSGSYSAMANVTDAAYSWDNTLHLSGSATQADGLIFYNHRLYSAVNTLNSGDFRNSADGGSLANGPSANPNYSGLSSGTKTFFRAFKNTTGGAVRDLDLTFAGDSTTIVDVKTALNSGRVRVLTKIPGKTGWMDCAQAFTYQSQSFGNGAHESGVGFDSSIAPNSVNVITFGTSSIANNEHVMFAIEADAGWTGYIDTMTVNFPAAGSISAAPTLDDIDCNDSGTAAKLSFGSSKSISGYTNHGAGAGFSAVDINGNYQEESNSNNLKRAVFDGATVIDGDLNEDVSSTTHYLANSFNQGHTGSLKLEVNGSVIHTVDLYNFTLSGNDLNGDGSGFTNLTVPANPVDSQGVKDYTNWYRTGKYKVTTDSQRNGWNYARVIHSVDGSDSNTNYVEWINDPDANALTTANAAYSVFGSSVTYYQSGVKYFVSPTGSLAFTINNCYRNVYSNSSSAITINGLSNFSVSNIALNGTGISNSSTAAASVPLPNLDTSATDPHTLPVHATASLSFTQATSLPTSSIAGGSQYNAAAASTILHPLKANGTLSSQTKSNFLVFSGSNSSNLNTEEQFVQEQFRVQSGSYTTQNSSFATMWNSSVSINDNGSYPNYATGLLIYNSRLISPKKGPVNGDFRDVSEGGDLTSPIGNPNYSTLTNSVRHYLRHFKNNTTTDTPQVTITLRGDATIVARQGAGSGTLGANKNIFVDVKIPGKTGYLDMARPSAGSGNILNGDGGLSGGLDSTVDSGGATNICTFNGQTVNGTASSPEYIIVSIVAHENWTGYLSRITVAYS